jgi:short-subunit dehydrogenase involved in D-alanine esterification of teichoic acids
MIKISIILFIIFASVSAHDIINEFKNANNFTGRVVLVTESTSDMGEIIVELFSSLGAKVVVTGSNETRLIKVAEDVTQLLPNGFKVYIYLSRILSMVQKFYSDLNKNFNFKGCESVD